MDELDVDRELKSQDSYYFLDAARENVGRPLVS